MTRMLAMMAPAYLSLLPLVWRKSSALACSSALMLAKLVTWDFIRLVQINCKPAAMIATVGRVNGSCTSNSRRSRPLEVREGE